MAYLLSLSVTVCTSCLEGMPYPCETEGCDLGRHRRPGLRTAPAAMALLRSAAWLQGKPDEETLGSGTC